MPYFLCKSEPDDYSYADLESDGSTVWDGVGNNLALKHMRTVKKGDTALIYHTGKDKHIAGIAKITTAAYEDPNDEKRVVFDVAKKQKLKRPVTLAEIKEDAAKGKSVFADYDLVKNPRLSVIPTTKAQFDRIMELSKQAR
ncbi:MAG: EVE domain-containing protein [Planctomycetota bacterium]